MIIDFPFILLFLVLASGLIAAIDKFVLKNSRPCIVAEYARAFFVIFLLVFVMRIFVVKPFRVPSQSLEPTVIPGDFLAVSQFSYGLRFPVWNKILLAIDAPHRGDIVVFRWPVNPRVNFVKRVIGLPGDRISYINKVLYINGKEEKQRFIKYAMDTNNGIRYWKVKVMEENLNGVRHKIYVRAENSINFYNLVVPKGEYFMMGDNRDDSEDSRAWGFVSNRDLVGKAMLIWMSWGGWKHMIRFKRIGKII